MKSGCTYAENRPIVVALSILIALLMFPKNIFGQQGNGTIRGRVVAQGNPVEFANIVLYGQGDSSRVLQTTISDSVGNFAFTGILHGNYIVKVQTLGYFSSSVKAVIDDKEPNQNLFEIQLQPDSKSLQTVEIAAQKKLIKKTEQGFIINAKDNLTQASGTATDLLKNTPTVVVNDEGNITVRGKTPLILINGRNSVLNATNRIPASSVESIEVINNPSAQYDADADGGIISIRLKKNEQGTNGSLALGAGYGAKGRANSAFLINHQAGKWNLGAAYDNRFAERTRRAEANRVNFDLPDEYYLLQNRHDRRLEQTQSIRLNVDYAIDKRNSLSFEAIGNFDGEDNYETLVSQIDNQNEVFQNKNSRFSSEHVREKAMEYALNYDHKFADARRKLSVSLSSSFNFDRENTDITTTPLDLSSGAIGTPLLQGTHDYQNSNVTNCKVDYAHPLGKKGTLETGYKLIARYTDADFETQYFTNGSFISNPLLTYTFHFREQIHAAYAQYRGYIGKPDSATWRYDIGLRAEQIYNHANATGNNISVNRDYVNLFPTANLTYYVNSADFARVSFSRRINRPSLGQLNPFIDITDSLNQHGGNPYLKPELINSVELGYNKELRKLSLSTTFFYRYATDVIKTYITLQPSGVALTQPANFGSSTTYGVEEIATAFPTKFWSVNVSLSLYQQLIDGSNISPDIANNIVSWYGKLINNINLWKGCKLQLLANYNAPIATPQGTRIAVYYIDAGLQQKIFKGKGAVGLVVTDILNTQHSGLTAFASDFSYHRTFKVDTRAALITFAYSFRTKFKEELLENKFSNE